MSKVKPLIVPLAVLIAGIVVGAIVGYSTVEVVDTGPWQLHPGFQAIYVTSVAEAYARNDSVEMALNRLGYLCETGGVNAAIDQALSTPNLSERQQGDLQELRVLADQWSASSPEVCQTKPSGLLGLVRQLLPVVGVLAVLGIGGYVGFSIYQERQAGTSGAGGVAKPEPKPEPAILGGSRASSKAPPTLEKAKSPAARGAAIAATTEKTDFAASGTPPLVQFMTTYLEGDDLFDDSFSIETPAGEFLGETGVGISETLGVGEPKRVTAMEVWLFDKNDIRTVTKVLMSDHAFNDEGLKMKLAPKGEAVLAAPGAIATLETASLRIQAKVVDLEYGSGPLPPNSFFQRITIELAAWKRDVSKATSPGIGAASPPEPTLPSFDD